MPKVCASGSAEAPPLHTAFLTVICARKYETGEPSVIVRVILNIPKKLHIIRHDIEYGLQQGVDTFSTRLPLIGNSSWRFGTFDIFPVDIPEHAIEGFDDFEKRSRIVEAADSAYRKRIDIRVFYFDRNELPGFSTVAIKVNRLKDAL